MYRPRSALRDLAEAFGLGAADSGRLARVMQWWDGSAAIAPRVRDAGFDPSSPWLARLLPLASALVAFPGFPLHLSQHGRRFVVLEWLLGELVPLDYPAIATWCTRICDAAAARSPWSIRVKRYARCGSVPAACRSSRSR